MRRAFFGGICWAALTLGCSNYMPITEEDSVAILIRGGNDALSEDLHDVPTRGFIHGCISQLPPDVAPGSICNPRFVPEEHDPDRIVVEEDQLGSFEPTCVSPEPRSQSMTHCFGGMPDANPGREFRVTINEHTGSMVKMPPVPALMSPGPGSKVSISEDDLVLSWEPLSSGHLIALMVFPTCAENLLALGEIEDSGSFVIPKTELPAGVPPEGCPTTVILLTRQDGALDPDIKRGRIVAESGFGVDITLVP